MNVQNDTRTTSARQLSGTGKIAGVSLLNFNDDYVYTKKKTKTGDSAYKKAIVEQAKADYKAGKFQNQSEEFNKLMKRYVSEVSPDRKGIITAGLRQLEKKGIPDKGALDVLELLLNGEVKYQKESGALTYAEFYDNNGELIATYSKGKWNIFYTDAEAARQIEMCQIYNSAWGDAKRAEENTGALYNTFNKLA